MSPQVPSAPAALFVCEVLEHILYFLPMNNIAINTRTCHFFRSTIQESIKLQRQLFIVPTPWQGAPPTNLPPRNPPSPASASSATSVSSATSDDTIYPEVALNPVLRVRRRGMRECPHGEVEIRIRPKLAHLNSAVSRMVLSNPIIPGMEAKLHIGLRNASIQWLLNIAAEDLTIGDFKAAEDAAIAQLGQVGRIRWLFAAPGGVDFFVDGEDLPSER